MLWGTPYALLMLGGVIPFIIFLHSLKPRGLKVATTALFLWERVLRERPLSTQLGWLLRKNLLLILQLLAAAALVAALAQPALLHFGAPSGDTVAVVDLSASMKAKGRAGTRFEAARRELLALIDALPRGQKMMVVGAGPQTRLVVPFTADRRRLREAARGLQATDAPGEVKQAILFAHAFLKRGSSDRVVAITDGAFAGAQDFARPSAPLSMIEVGGGKDNVAIVGLEARRHPEQAAVEVMVHVKNFTAKPVSVPLTLTLGETILAQETVAIEAEGRRVLIYPFANALSGVVTARLDLADDFATDNQAFLAVSDVPTVRLLYVGPGNPFLSHLLRFFPHVQVTAAERWEPEMAQGKEKHDIVVFDRVGVPALPAGNFVLINTIAPNVPLRAEGRLLNPRAVGALVDHPITEGLNLRDLYVRESLRLRVTGEGTVLARTADGPLLFALEKDKLRVLVIGFDLLASDLPLRVAFPILIHNTIQWFLPQRLEFPGQSVRAGEPFLLRLPTGDDAVELTFPSGKSEKLESIANPLRFAETLEAGVYGFRSLGREGRFAVNLFDEEESRIESRLNSKTAAVARNSYDVTLVESGFALWPLLLGLVIALLVAELIFAVRSKIPVLPILLRAATLTVLALALVNPRIFKAISALDVILGVDLSRSVGQEGSEKGREVLEVAGRLSNAATRTGVFAFGRGPEWEFLPRREFPVADFSSRLDREETDIQAALQAGLAQVGEGRQGRLLVISDGNENRGNGMQVVPLLRAQGIEVWTLPVSLARHGNEVFLSDLRVPRQVDGSERFEIQGMIESVRESAARIMLLRDGVLLYERDLQLKPGANPVNFHDNLTARGNHSYELLVESREDTLAENNLLQGVVEVKGPPRVLLISTGKESQRYLARVLGVQGYSVVQSAPETHPLSLPELSSFDLLVLDNVAAFRLTHAKMENIEKYVRDLGGGLLVIGGPQSYGAGGYYRTPLERILPVDMRPPARLDVPHVALLFVLDKSGSMGAGPEGGTKLDLAKAAAVAAADIMNPTDQVGILGFDAAWDWVLPFRQVGKGEWISDKLAGLQSDGGTDLYKAMQEAHRVISTKQAAIKHVIVLSDGLTDKADFPGLVARMTRAGITVSTVSVGNDADVRLMANIATTGKGRGYVALDPQTIPQIFTTETLLISRDLLVEKPVTPTIVAPIGPLKGIDQRSLPLLHGYVLTYPKPRAEILMRADKEPLLVSWRHGLGRVVAFTSDLSGRWGREWVAWQGLPQWASQIVRDTMRRILNMSARTEFSDEKEQVKVTADFLSRDGRFLNHLKIKSKLTAPNKSTQEHDLQQTAPGRYEGKFVPAQRGIHFLTLYLEENGGETSLPVATIPYIAPYPKEYRELKPNLSLLSRIAEETGGELLDPEKIADGVKRLYAPTPGKASHGQETWWPLAGAGLFLLLADLLLRSWPPRMS